MHLHVRTCARADVPSVLYLGNGWTDCAEIWYVVRGQLAKQLTQASIHLRSFIAQKASYWCVRVNAYEEFVMVIAEL